MKKLKFFSVLAIALIPCITLLSCGDDPEPEPEPDPVTPTNPFEVDESFIPNETFMQKTWVGEYEGWDDIQQKNTKIKRKLTLYANKKYTNVIQGVLSESGKTDLVDFERESGTYTYNSRTGVITYSVTSDSIIQYKDQQFIGYSMKKFYDYQLGTYTEDAKFTSLNEGTRKWITKDTYLQSLTDKTLDISFSMDVEK